MKQRIRADIPRQYHLLFFFVQHVHTKAINFFFLDEDDQVPVAQANDRGGVSRAKPVLTHRYTMPIIDDAEGDSNDDESVLETMAKV